MRSIYLLAFMIYLLKHRLVKCTYSIFLDTTEVFHLLGCKSEIYYVRSGTILENALQYLLTIPTDRNTISFTWESQTSDTISYEWDIRISDEKVVTSVTMNVSNIGDLPTTREKVETYMNCSGLEDNEAIVEFRLNLTLSSNIDNVKQITFKRKKLCRRDYHDMSSDVDHHPVSIEGFDSAPLKVFYIVLCFGCSLFTLLIVCFLAYIVSNKKNSRRDPLQTEQQMRLRSSENENAPYVLNTLGINSGTSTSSNISHVSARRNKHFVPIDTRSLDLHEKISEINIPRKRIRLQKIELEGTFGRVFNGTYSREDGSEENVLVKTVMDFASITQVSMFLKEGLSLYGLKHRNIMSVMAVSVEDNVEPFVIYLRQGYSNLKKFLQKCKHGPEGATHTLTTQEVVEIALQIILGVQYMHKKKILHKDLATRNCQIDASLNVKITDNALSRDLFPNDYHCLGDNENRPVKWLAIESLVHKTFSTASDVWSYGVTLWELTTLAQQPYVEVDPFEIEHYLKDGYRLSQPVNCPDELFAVMAYCWAMSPDERPTFSQLQTCLQDFHNQLNKYV